MDPVLTTLVVLGLAIIAMIFVRTAPENILLTALSVLILLGIVDAKKAFMEGFGNSALVTIAALFVVAEGLRQTGAINYLVQSILGQPKSALSAQARLMIPAGFFSSFINNTPVVAMLLPVVDDWGKKCRISVSRLLLPLSYATILGGMCTEIGTSTSIILYEMINDTPDAQKLSFFGIGAIGLPATILGVTYLLITSKWLLPDRKPVFEQLVDPREYTFEMVVEASSPLVGKTIEQAGLRNLPGAYLIEIDRGGAVLAAVTPREIINANDRFVFVGVVDSVIDLQKIPGLKPATEQLFKLDSPRSQRCLIEAVVSDSCPIVNMTIRDAQFRTRYNAAIIAVSRNGERVSGKIGNIFLMTGDTLLLEAHPSFADVQRNSRDFFLVSRVEDSNPPRHEKSWVAQLLLVIMITMALTPSIGMLKGALLVAMMMIATRCVRTNEARRAIDWSVLLTIGAGLGLGVALKESGTDTFIAENVILALGNRPLTVLATIYGLTMVLTNLITAKAAAVLIFPIAIAAAKTLSIDGVVGLDPTPFGVAVMIAAAASFATPIGFQTNLMVYGPGGYRYSDFLRVGGPLSLLIWVLSIFLIPFFWPLQSL